MSLKSWKHSKVIISSLYIDALIFTIGTCRKGACKKAVTRMLERRGEKEGEEEEDDVLFKEVRKLLFFSFPILTSL